MPTPTPELGLQQALNADDNADYLVDSLAAALVTIDSLFNAVSGHTHGDVHQGGPIHAIPASAIPDGSITSAKIADGTIATVDLADAAITAAKLASGAVGSPAIAAGVTITSPTINGGTITSPTISGASITNPTISGTISGAPTFDVGPYTPDWWHNSTAGNGMFNTAVQIGVGIDAGGPYVYGGYGGGHLITEAAAQTLTNKTLTSPVLNGAQINSSTINGSTINTPTITGRILLTDPNVFIERAGSPAYLHLYPSVVVAGNLGVQGVVPATYAIQLPNAASPAGQGYANQWISASSRKDKDNVTPLTGALNAVLDDALHAIRYDQAGVKMLGFLAEDWLTRLPEVVALDADGAPIGLEYGRISAIVFEALKEFVALTNARFAALEAR